MKLFGRVTVTGVLIGILITMVSAGTALAKPKSATVTIPTNPDIYISEPLPLTQTQCVQCHPSLFQTIKESGARHRFACQKCHNTFHAYNPRKGNWDSIMPKCASCHDQPHGPNVTDCMLCHFNPHAPKKIPATPMLAKACFDCHSSVRDQLVKYPSKHSKVACMTCHTSHGYKPSCFTCHKPHQTGQVLSTCIACHPVHQPLQISYGKGVPSDTCGSCHAKVYSTWKKGASKHKEVACVSCHKNKHRAIPQCSDCHGKPHLASLHDRFPKCLACHIDVHDPPVMSLKQNN